MIEMARLEEPPPSPRKKYSLPQNCDARLYARMVRPGRSRMSISILGRYQCVKDREGQPITRSEILLSSR
jgi:hypothetical protein